MGHRSHRYREELAAELTPPADVYETRDALVAVFELPGVSLERVSVLLEGNVLVVAGHRAENRADLKFRLHQMEIVYGRFERRISLPPGVPSTEIRAQYQNGVLRVEIPKRIAHGRDEKSIVP